MSVPHQFIFALFTKQNVFDSTYTTPRMLSPLRINSIIFSVCNRHAERQKFMWFLCTIDCRHWMIFIAHQHTATVQFWLTIIAPLVHHVIKWTEKIWCEKISTIQCNKKKKRIPMSIIEKYRKIENIYSFAKLFPWFGSSRIIFLSIASN